MFYPLHPARHCFHQQEQMALSTEFIPSAGSQLCTTGKVTSLYISNANFNFIVTLSSTYLLHCSFPNPFSLFLLVFHAGPSPSFCKTHSSYSSQKYLLWVCKRLQVLLCFLAFLYWGFIFKSSGTGRMQTLYSAFLNRNFKFKFPAVMDKYYKINWHTHH